MKCTTQGVALIQSFRHKGLEKLFNNDGLAGQPAKRAQQISLYLDALNKVTHPSEVLGVIEEPGIRLHPFKKDKDFWSMSVSGNLRLTFRFVAGDAHDINLEDYH